MTASYISSRPHRRRRPSSSTPRHRIVLRSFLTTTTILLLAFFVQVSTLISSSTALPVTLQPRRNPLTVGLGLGSRSGGGRGIGINLGGGGGALLNLHRSHNRAIIESSETQAAEYEAIVSTLQKRSTLEAPISGANAEISDSTGTIITNTDASTPYRAHSMHAAALNKRQHSPGTSPGSGSGTGYNKNDPFDRR
ncbi:MAG: hypothetical protein J3R72DRAFT_232038 [Linnemannia gamsii]|nr:MAG: hypothetical protein J3R72DRAFT_232038 [Linnemannia gamsii]